MRSKLAWVWSLVLLALLNGCSVVSLTYERADWFALRYAERFVSFDAQQRASLELALSVRHEEHRRGELPKYVAFLRQLEAMSRDGLTRHEAMHLLASVRDLYEEGARRTAPVTAPVLVTLSPTQIDELAENLQAQNREYIAEQLPADDSERDRRRFERSVDRLQGWVGRLQPAQVEIVRDGLARLPDLRADWFEYRVAQQMRLIDLLHGGTSIADLESFLLDWWTAQSALDASVRETGERMLSQAADLLVAVDASLTPRQRKRVLRKITKYRTGLEDVLARDQIAAAPVADSS